MDAGMEQDTQSETYELPEYNQVELDDKNAIQRIRFPDASTLIAVRVDYNGDGVGEVQYENGGAYLGELKGGSPGGFGLYFVDDMTIAGIFADQTLDGIGAVRHHNGSMAAGTFHSGQLGGYGSQFDAQQRIYYAGQYRMSRPNGLGTLIQGDIDLIYQKSWQHCLQFGTFVDGSLNGRGVSIMAAQADVNSPFRFNRYEGYFTYGIRDGSGALFLANGDLLVGNFRRGVKHGLFVHVSAQGSLTLRFYDGDVVRRSYYSVEYYVPQAQLLRCLQFEALDVESYDAHVAYFKSLEQGKSPFKPEERFPTIDTLFRLCKRLTAPLQAGVCEDPRVCQPLLSECINETVRSQDGGCLEDTALFRAVDDLKSAVINSFDVFKFLFDFYRARDNFVISNKNHKSYPATIQAAFDEFSHICGQIDAESLAQKQAEMLERQREFERAQEQQQNEKEEEEAESESNENKNQLKDNHTDSPDKSINKGMTDNNTPTGGDLHDLQTDHSVASGEGPEVNLDRAGQSPASPLRQSIGADTVFENKHPTTATGYAQLAREFLEKIQDVPLGINETDNELLQIFCMVLDTQQQLTRQSATALVHDMASVLGLQRELRSNEQYLLQLALQSSSPSDSSLMLHQFGINGDFNVSDRVFNLETFICFMLRVPELFGIKTALSFIQNQLTSFARKIMEGLATILADDQEQLDKFLESMEARQGISTQSTRRLGTAQTSPGTQSINTHTGPRSQVSKYTKNTLTSYKTQQTIPRVLVRDFSYQLSDVERALMRTAGLTGKVSNLYQIRADNQRGLLFHTQINEQLERLVTSEQAGVIAGRLDFDGAQLTLLQFLQLGMNGLSNLFGFPSFDDNVQFYANALIPFYLRYTPYDVYQVLFDIYNAKQKSLATPQPDGTEGGDTAAEGAQPPATSEVQAEDGTMNTARSSFFKTAKKTSPLDEDVPLQDFYEVASTEIMTSQKLLGALSCLLLKSPNTYEREAVKDDVNDTEEQTSQLNSDDMAASVRSDNSLYSKNQTLLQEQQQLKDRSMRQDAIQQCMELPKPCLPTAVIQLSKDFFSGLETLIYDQ